MKEDDELEVWAKKQIRNTVLIALIVMLILSIEVAIISQDAKSNAARNDDESGSMIGVYPGGAGIKAGPGVVAGFDGKLHPGF